MTPNKFTDLEFKDGQWGFIQPQELTVQAKDEPLTLTVKVCVDVKAIDVKVVGVNCKVVPVE
jgi:hypothetical protein